MAFLIERMGYVNCDEARATLTKLVIPWEHCPYGLHIVASYSIIRLSLVPGIPLLVKACWWFDGIHSYYHQNILSLVRNASEEFKRAFATEAMNLLKAPSESIEHAKGACILGYLGDNRLVAHLDERLQANNRLFGYENHALFAVGTQAATEVFVKAANQTATKIEAIRKENEDAAAMLWYDVALRSADLRHLVTEPFEKCLLSLIDSGITIVVRFATDLSFSSRRPVLLRRIIFSEKETASRWLYEDDLSEAIPISDWLDWWASATSTTIKASILKLTGKVPDLRVEDIAIECLKVPELRSGAAYALARAGTLRCLTRLRETLNSVDIKSSDSFSFLFSAVQALGNLRDKDAVELLGRIAEDEQNAIRQFALDALAKIGTDEAADVLINLSKSAKCSDKHKDFIIESLIAHGSALTVGRAIEIARGRAGGPKWLVQQIKYVFRLRGWKVGEYYAHVHDKELVEYLASAESSMDPTERRDLLKSFEQIDSQNVRRILWVFANRVGTNEDVKVVLLKNHDGIMLSSEALEELINRADEGTLPHVIGSALRCKDGIFTRNVERMAKFPSALIIREVKRQLAVAGRPAEQTARLLSIFGAYGNSTDIGDATPFLDMPDESVRNVSYETTTLLLDPLRIAEGWREMYFGA
ncbi:MAG TPA: HEAT repeat domain-containing protein [Candidatus Angelobacter sp.]|nr:HEAT repeat domain-containing protein [Candidatus Angelobacter sp.]